MLRFKSLFSVLSKNNVEYILIGGVAAVLHGSSRLTQDVDIVYNRSAQNIRNIVNALSPFAPYLRDAPKDLPFVWSEQTLKQGLNFTLSTKELGPIDLFGEIISGGDYQKLLPHSIEVEIFNSKCLVLELEKLIQVKRAAGRPKDLESIAELEKIKE